MYASFVFNEVAGLHVQNQQEYKWLWTTSF